jgi:hypothetical protein
VGEWSFGTTVSRMEQLDHAGPKPPMRRHRIRRRPMTGANR